MKELKAFAAALAVACAGAAGAADVTAAYYVQDGLVALYDGIDNAGFGSHDANATTWKDLSGNGHDFTVFARGSGSVGGTWEANALNFAGYTATLSPQLPAYLTQEIRLKVTSGRWILVGHAVEDRVRQGLVTVNGFVSKFQTCYNGQQTPWLDATSYTAPYTTTVLYDENLVSTACYANSAATPSYTGSNNWEDNGTSAIGNIPYTIGTAQEGTWPGYGSLYSVRLYSRNLTADERAHNYLVDRIRFEDAEPPATVAPTCTATVVPGETSGGVAWNVSDFGWLASGLSQVTVVHSASSDFSSATTNVASLATTEAAGSYLITGLVADTHYYVRVMVANDHGAVWTSDVIDLDTSAAGNPVGALTSFAVDAMSARIGYQLLATGSDAACGAYATVTGDGFAYTWTLFASAAAGHAVTVEADMLLPATDYVLTVTTTNASGQTHACSRNITTPAEEYPALGYVRDGLLLQLDAIANAKTNGVPVHDASATTWTDLAGSHAFAAAGAAFEVKDDLYRFPDKSSYLTTSAADLSAAVLAGTFTVESLTRFYTKPTELAHCFGLYSIGSGGTGAPRTLTFDTRYYSDSAGTYCGLIQFNQSGFINDTVNYLKSDTRVDFTNELSFAVVGGGSSGQQALVYADGDYVQRVTDRGSYTSATIPANPVLAVRNYADAYSKTDYRAFRFYNRSLTADEVARNRACDEARFYGGAIPALEVVSSACEDGVLTVTLRRGETAAAAIGAICSSTYGADTFVWTDDTFAAGETEATISFEPADGVKFVRFTAGGLVAPTVSLPRLAALPRAEVTKAVCNDAALAVTLVTRVSGDVTCWYGAADGGSDPAAWDGSVACGTYAAGTFELAVTNLPASAAYVRFRVGGGWSATLALASVRVATPFLHVSAVSVYARSVTFDCAVYGTGDGTFSLGVAFGPSAAELDDEVTLATDRRLDEKFTVSLGGLQPATAYVIRPVVTGVTAACDDLAVTTAASGAEPVYAGPAITVTPDPSDATKLILTFDAPGLAATLYELNDTDDRGLEPGDWAVTNALADVAADDTTVTVSRPAGWGTSVYASRYCLISSTPGTMLYRTVSGGTIFAQWDAIDNAGVDTHDATRQGLKDLRGSADLSYRGSGASNDGTNVVLSGGSYGSDTTGAPWLKGNCTTAKDAVFANSFTAEFSANLGSDPVNYGGVLCIGNPSGQRILMLDTRTESAPTYYGALQYATASWPNESCRIAAGTLKFGTYAHYALVCDSTGAHLYVDGVLKHTQARNGLTAGSDELRIGRYDSSCAKMSISGIRFHDKPLTTDELAYNRIVDRARFLGESGPKGGTGTIAMSAPLYYEASDRPNVETATAEGAAGDVANFAGTFTGVPTAGTVEYWAEGAAVTSSVDVVLVEKTFAATADVLPGTTYGWRVTLAAGTKKGRATGSFTTPAAAAAATTQSSVSGITATYTACVTQQGAGDTYLWIEGKPSTSSDWTRLSDVTTVPCGNAGSRTLSGKAGFVDATANFRLVVSNACTRPANGSWTSYIGAMTQKLTDAATYTYKTSGTGNWGDATRWTGSDTLGWGSPVSASSSIVFPANAISTIGVDGQYSFSTWSAAVGGSYATVTGCVAGAKLTCNMTGGGLRGGGIVLRDVEVAEANGFDFGSYGSTNGYLSSGENLLWLQKGAKLTIGNNLSVAGAYPSEVRISDDGELVCAAELRFYGRGDAVHTVRFEGAAPKVTATRVGSSYVEIPLAQMNADVEFVYDVPADIPSEGYARAPVYTTGEDAGDRFGMLSAEATGKFIFRVDARSGAFSVMRRTRVQLAACRAGIVTNNVAFAKYAGPQNLRYEYTYGWPTEATQPTAEGELPTGIRATLQPRCLHPSAEGATYGVAVLGDLHYDGTQKSDYHAAMSSDTAEFKRNYTMWAADGPSRAILAASASVCAAKPTMFALQLGDLTQGDTGSTTVHTQMLTDAATLVGDTYAGLPVALTCGNHDIRSGNSVNLSSTYKSFATTWLTERLSSLLETVEDTTYYFTYGGDLYIVIDYNRPDLGVIERALRANESARHTFVVTHAPVFPMNQWRGREFLYGGEGQTVQRRRLRRLLAQREAIVLCGHVHTFEHHDWYGDGGRITEIIMNTVNAATGGSAFPAEPNVLVTSSASYGAGTTGTLGALFDEYRPGLATCWESQAVGHARLEVGDRTVKFVYYGRTATAPTATILLRRITQCGFRISVR